MSEKRKKNLDTKGHNISSLDISMNMSMDIVMQNYSQTIRILQQNNLHCIGCPLAPFHNVEDAAIEHGLNAKTLLNQLQQS